MSRTTSPERKPTPRDFPVLFPMRVIRDIYRRNPQKLASYRACRTCGLAITHRNARRHEAACRRRKRLAPELWREWQKDMRS